MTAETGVSLKGGGGVGVGGYGFSPAMAMLPPLEQFRFGRQDPHNLHTLANLFDTLTVECSGVLVQPQWKHFAHIEMVKNDKIRLSNGIWRSWHLQFQKRRVPKYCRFDIEPKLDHHKKQTTHVLEGKYWKRTQSAVATEYRKWRLHHHKRNKTRKPDPFMANVVQRAKAIFRELQGKPHPPQTITMDQPRMILPNVPDLDPLLSLMDTSPSISDSMTGIMGLQQPRLDMLNPMIDDFLNRLEPMDVVLPRPVSGTFYQRQQQVTPTFETQNTTPPLTYSPYTSSQHHNMSPTSFLNMPLPENGRGNIDITQLTTMAMKQEPVINYQQASGSQDFNAINSTNVTSPVDIFNLQATLQRKVDDMEGAFRVTPPQLHSTQHTSSQPHTITPSAQQALQFSSQPTYSQANQYMPTGGHMTHTHDHMMERPLPRVSSAGDLGMVEQMPRPPLERGKSEPTRRLREKMQQLHEEHEKQLQEIDKQKNLAEQQYSELLQTVMQQVSSGKASEQQKQVLQGVLADPSLVTILRDVLLTTPSPAGQEVGGSKFSLAELHRRTVTPELTSPQNVLSPVMGKASSIGDLPGGLKISLPSSGSPYSNYLSGSDTEAPSTGMALSQLRVKQSRNLSTEEKEVYKEMRRQSHISAEQKRRGSIKQGFDHLQSLVVNLSSYPSGKVSKAVILEKTIDHIHHCHLVRDERERKILALRKEIEELNVAIAHCQERLPASGVPLTRQRFEENRQRFREYVQRRTQQNYKFWIFGIILRQLFESYNSTVSTGSVDELCRTVLAWFNQSCALPALRPVVMNSLRELSQKTSILTDPSQVPRQLAQYAQQDLQLHRQEQEKARTTRFSLS